MGDWVECPVSGVPLQVTEASTRVTYAGHSYVVCCGGCSKMFDKDPASFLEATCRPVAAEDPG